MPRRFAIALSVLALCAGAARAATNLVANPSFHDGVSHWTLAGGGGYTLGWSPIDESGDPASGSLRLTTIAPLIIPGIVGECFPVAPGATLVYGASFWNGLSPNGTAHVQLRLFDAAGCAGAQSQSSVAEISAGSSTWSPIQRHLTAKGSIHSGRLTLGFSSPLPVPDEVRFDNAFVYSGQSCAATNLVACLDQRFRVTMDWQTPDGTRGSARMRAFTSDSAYASFFAAENVEVVLKVLDACALNDRYWVFAAGMTSVEVHVIVTDTQHGVTWDFLNPLDEPFPPVQDTATFAVCPS